jgi:polyphenol oxidase
MPVDKIIEDEQILTDSGFYWREHDGVKVLVCRALEEQGFANGFSTRLGGVSPFPENNLNLAGFDEDLAENIYENRRRFLNVFAGDFQLATAWQVHGDGVKIVKTNEDAVNSDEKFDSLVSNLDNVLIGVKTADCVPVLIGDTKTKAYAAVHAGWRGTVQSIVRKSVEAMQKMYGTDPQNLVCAIGPAAGCESYEIGSNVIEAFADSFKESGKYFRKTRDGHALVDLHSANEDQLLGLGIPAENIFKAPFCTMARTDLFFSYRVEKKLYGKTGRLMSVIGRVG